MRVDSSAKRATATAPRIPIVPGGPLMGHQSTPAARGSISLPGAILSLTGQLHAYAPRGKFNSPPFLRHALRPAFSHWNTACPLLLIRKKNDLEVKGPIQSASSGVTRCISYSAVSCWCFSLSSSWSRAEYTMDHACQRGKVNHEWITHIVFHWLIKYPLSLVKVTDALSLVKKYQMLHMFIGDFSGTSKTKSSNFGITLWHQFKIFINIIRMVCPIVNWNQNVVKRM